MYKPIEPKKTFRSHGQYELEMVTELKKRDGNQDLGTNTGSEDARTFFQVVQCLSLLDFAEPLCEPVFFWLKEDYSYPGVGCKAMQNERGGVLKGRWTPAHPNQTFTANGEIIRSL